MTNRASFHGSGAVSFSSKGEYGVRLMVQLGRRYGTGPASLAEIALDEDLPRAYLEQLVTSLRDAGLVTSTRGARGGYELNASPADIRMSDILRALEGPIAPMRCASDEPEHQACSRSAACTVNLLWIRVRDAISGALDSMTLADLVPIRHITLDPREPAPAPAPAVVA
ncbi:MAG TPA: Rrf2 family transcriptional regulator [Candidatus Methylomirabilis sp.]